MLVSIHAHHVEPKGRQPIRPGETVTWNNGSGKDVSLIVNGDETVLKNNDQLTLVAKSGVELVWSTENPTGTGTVIPI